MNKPKLRRTLEELAEEGVPAQVDLWPRLLARHEISRGPNRPLRLRRRLGWAGLAVAGLLMLGATAYAASPVINRLLTMDDQFNSSDAQRLGKTLDLSQTLGDVTATVQWAYADPRRVLVGYTIKTSNGRRFDPAGATLLDANGTTLHSMGGYGVVGHSDLLGVSLPPGEETEVVVFDSPAGAGQAQTLKLHLSLSAAEYAYPTQAATPVVQGNTAEAQPVVLLNTAGPFEFDFEVPFTHSH